MKQKLLIIGRGVAGRRYKDIIAAKFPELETCLHKRNRELNFHHFVIIASSTKNHFLDIVASVKNCRKLLVEKPLVTTFAELKKVDNLIKENKVEIFTGDQFYHSKALLELKEIIRKEGTPFKLDITYSDSLVNVTKGKTDSYFFDGDSGGVLYTLSHAYFVFELLLHNIEYKLLSAEKNFLKKHPTITGSVISEWCDQNRNQVTVTTDVKSDDLKFEVSYQSQLSSIVIDLIRGEVTNNGKRVAHPSQSRMDLIENNIINFLSDEKSEQFKVSSSALSKIWKVIHCQ